ncbi:MAG: M24 family metallopeptidase [Candidatus Aenigmatarchaeota archaeon]
MYELANYYRHDSLSFEPIVAGGNNSSIPHYKRSNYKIEKNNVLLIDFGVKYKGYVSDMTRTIRIGNNVSNEFKRAYNIVSNAQDLAISECKFKNKKLAGEIHKKVVNFINSTEFKNKFLHGTGHGIGLDIHELPYLNIKSKDVLVGNEVVTIEPGIYLEGKFGIRIEDVIITKSGKKLSKSTKDMVIL